MKAELEAIYVMPVIVEQFGTDMHVVEVVVDCTSAQKLLMCIKVLSLRLCGGLMLGLLGRKMQF